MPQRVSKKSAGQKQSEGGISSSSAPLAPLLPSGTSLQIRQQQQHPNDNMLYRHTNINHSTVGGVNPQVIVVEELLTNGIPNGECGGTEDGGDGGGVMLATANCGMKTTSAHSVRKPAAISVMTTNGGFRGNSSLLRRASPLLPVVSGGGGHNGRATMGSNGGGYHQLLDMDRSGAIYEAPKSASHFQSMVQQCQLPTSSSAYNGQPLMPQSTTQSTTLSSMENSVTLLRSAPIISTPSVSSPSSSSNILTLSNSALASNPPLALSALNPSELGPGGTTTVYQVIGDKPPNIIPAQQYSHAAILSQHHSQLGQLEHMPIQSLDERMMIIGSPSYRQPSTPSLAAASLHHHALLGGAGGVSTTVIGGIGSGHTNALTTSSPYLSCYDAAMGDYSVYYQHYQPAQTPPVQQLAQNGGRASGDEGVGNNGSLPMYAGVHPHHHHRSGSSPSLSVDDGDETTDDEGRSGGAANGRRTAARLAAHQRESMNGNNGLGHTARTPPETLEWLSRNYEPCAGASLPRCTLYEQYLGHCLELELDPVNAASFGKLIRSVFKGLKTRRLGTRGNSKYHYDGIRIKPNSSLLTCVPPQDYIGPNPVNFRAGGCVGMGRNTVGIKQGGVRRIGGPFRHSTHPYPAQTQSMAAVREQSETQTVTTYQLRPRNHNNAVVASLAASDQVGDAEEAIMGRVAFSPHNNANYTIEAFEEASMGNVVNCVMDEGAGCAMGVQPEGSADTTAAGGMLPSNASSLNNSGNTTTTSGRATPSMGGHQQASDSEIQGEGRELLCAAGNGSHPPQGLPAIRVEEMEAKELEARGLTVKDVEKFAALYTENCEAVLDAIRRLRFNSVGKLWKEFWSLHDGPDGRCDDEMIDGPELGEQAVKTEEDIMAGEESQAGKVESNNDKHRVEIDEHLRTQLCSLPQIQRFVQHMDVALYQLLVDTLMPDVLRTVVPSRLSYQIRNFARNMEQWMKASLGAEGQLPSQMRASKIMAVRLFANALTRYTSFNHLADAARAVLKNRDQMAQMYDDFCRVDFSIVHSQADWVCGCDSQLVLSVEASFRENLRLQKNLNEWTEWMEAVVDQLLAPYHDKPVDVLLKASKQFLLKWSFYSSMILRDVTYRSAQSFGSFHLIRLLYDEYMFLLVEMRLARATNRPVICVMGEEMLPEHVYSVKHPLVEKVAVDQPNGCCPTPNGDTLRDFSTNEDIENLIDAAREMAEIAFDEHPAMEESAEGLLTADQKEKTEQEKK